MLVAALGGAATATAEERTCRGTVEVERGATLRASAIRVIGNVQAENHRGGCAVCAAARPAWTWSVAGTHAGVPWLRMPLLWLTLSMLTACGGSDTEVRDGSVTLPTPVEDAESAAAKMIAAAGSGDCARMAQHIHGDEGLPFCRTLEESGSLETIARWDGSVETFGTAALGEVRNTDGSTAYIVLALDPQRRFKFVTITPQDGNPLDDNRADAQVEDGVSALRDDDCDAFYRLSAQLLSAEDFCQATWVRDFQAAVTAAEEVSTQHLGGNGYISFYAVAADRYFYTVSLFLYDGAFTWASAAPSA